MNLGLGTLEQTNKNGDDVGVCGAGSQELADWRWLRATA